MEIEELKILVQNIVAKATKLKNLHTDELQASVNYACIFCHSKEEYNEFLSLVDKIGSVIKETHNGPLFHIQDLETISGKLKLLKIRMPDSTRPECGDADFTVSNYGIFKEESLVKSGFKLIDRGYMEMIELMDSDCDVRAYFSNPPLDMQLGLGR